MKALVFHRPGEWWPMTTTSRIAYTVTGTHRGDFQGVAPAGKKIKARGVQIARFEDGKIAERWGSSDELGHFKTTRRGSRRAR